MPEFSQIETAKIEIVRRGEFNAAHDCFVVLPSGEKARLPIKGYEVKGQAQTPEEVDLHLYSYHIDFTNVE